MGYALQEAIYHHRIHNYKVHLNAHGGQKVQGVYYWDMNAPVVTWFAIRIMLTLVLLHKWSTLTVDFVLACPQAVIDSETYIKLPRGINFRANISRSTHVLKLLQKHLWSETSRTCMESAFSSQSHTIKV